MCIAQSKIGVALNESAKKFSEYGYIYSLIGFKEVQENSYEKEEGTITDFDSAISELEDAKNAFDSIAGVTESEDPWTDLENAENSAKSAEEKYLTIYKNFVDNLTETTKSKNGTRNFESSGGFEQALKDFIV